MNDFNYPNGVYSIAPTPFHPDGSLDKQSIFTLVDFLISKGVNGITILGVLGESGKVSDAERVVIIESYLQAADGRVPICVGTSHAATGRCVEFSRQAQDMGASSVMVAPPKLSRSSDSALRKHYEAVANAIDIPLVVQDHPASSGVFMSVEFIASLARDLPQCGFLKLEDEPSPIKVSQVLAANPNIRVFGGLGGIMFYEELRRGATGTMTGFAFPEILVSIYQKYTAGDVAAAADLFDRYCSLIRFENQARINLTLRKYIYYKRGAIASERVREPFVAIDAETLADLEDLLTRYPI
jgi:4-hydroxy-tetrahydrodipicolinate synthase